MIDPGTLHHAMLHAADATQQGSADDIAQRFLALAASLKALVDSLKRAFPTRLKDGRVVLLLLILSAGLGAVVAFAVFQPVRLWVYTTIMMLLGSLGIDVSRHWQPDDDPSDAPPSQSVRPIQPPQKGSQP